MKKFNSLANDSQEKDDDTAKVHCLTCKGNETKYWPLILGIGVILVIGVVVWMVRKNQRKNK